MTDACVITGFVKCFVLRWRLPGDPPPFGLSVNNAESLTMTVLGYKWEGKKVLVTGASGFKGSWLSKVLLSLGAEVHGTVRPSINPHSAYSLFDLDNDLVTSSPDLSIRQEAFDLVNSLAPDVIIHLAAKAQVPVSTRDPRRALDVNIMGTINLLEACRELGLARRVLIVSTDHVFGNVPEREFPNRGFDEEKSHIGYGGPYDTSKSAMELCARCYHQTYWEQMPAIGITRAANVFGYGDVAPRRVIPSFIISAIEEPRKIRLACRLNGRQFIFITDIVEGYLQAVSSLNDDDPSMRSKSKPDGRTQFTPTFHFALEDYGKNSRAFVRITDLAVMISTYLSATVEESPNCVDYAPNENRIQALNCERTRAILEWKPRVTLEHGIKKTAEWYKHASDHAYLRKLLNEEVDNVLTNLS